jgi:tetrapyrrole methylase family protein / MazG family protein
MPTSITVVGLGPGGEEQWTTAARQVLLSAEEVWLRTARHPGVEALGKVVGVEEPAVAGNGARVISFDPWYDGATEFSSLYQRIAQRVVELGQRPSGVVYAVPGHPMIGEATVRHIRALAADADVPVRIVAGLSFIEPTLTALGVDALDGLQIADADQLATQHHPSLDPDRPALVAQLFSRRQASGVKLTLMNGYPDDHEVSLVRAAGTEREQIVVCPLFELDRQPIVDHLTTLYVPPLPRPGGLPTLQETVAHLRAPEGCPWDREQTHQSLRPYLLEETYEVLAALDAEDYAALTEEMGDLLLQIVLHAQIGVEQGEYSMANVISAVDSKMHRRHPHVFGGLEVNGVSEVLVNWEAIKKAEHAEADAAAGGREGNDDVGGNGNRRESVIDGVPAALPALARAQAISSRAVRIGFEWPNIDGVWAKLDEEVRELVEAETEEDREAELGDVLFVMVNLARWLGIDAESALRTTNERFSLRFRYMERIARQRGINLADLDIDGLDALWDAAKTEIEASHG